MIKSKKDKRQKARYSIRKKISGTSERPRLAVFRSNKQIYVQLIDDVTHIGRTIKVALEALHPWGRAKRVKLFR